MIQRQHEPAAVRGRSQEDTLEEVRALKGNQILLLAILESAGAMGVSINDFVARISELDCDITRGTFRACLQQLLEFGFVETTMDMPLRVCITEAGKTALRNWRAKK
ncbi:MAG: hypothetical protein ABSD58_03865 [Verrucomicrobiia bacterium]